MDALNRLVKELMVELPPVLHHWLLDTFRAPPAWFDARLAFTRSCAVMAMIGMAEEVKALVAEFLDIQTGADLRRLRGITPALQAIAVNADDNDDEMDDVTGDDEDDDEEEDDDDDNTEEEEEEEEEEEDI